MRSTGLFTSICVFGVFLTAGLWSGRQIHALAQHSPVHSVPKLSKAYHTEVEVATGDASTSAISNQSEGSVGSNLQENLLLIAVDQMDNSAPKLKAVWLVMQIKGNSHLTWMPIFPTLSEDKSGNLIQDQFNLDKTLLPTEAFLSCIYEQGLWWNGYLVIDQTAAAALTKAIASEPFKQPSINSPSNPDPQSEIKRQAGIISWLCQQSAGKASHFTLQTLEKLSPSHLVSNLELETLFSLWQNNPGTQVTCEFPSLGH
jgi:hypothetical protein